MTEFVSERRHIDNLVYVRDLLKLDLDYWVQTRKSGKNLKDTDSAMEIIDCLEVVENCLGGIHAQIAALEELKNEDY